MLLPLSYTKYFVGIDQPVRRFESTNARKVHDCLRASIYPHSQILFNLCSICILNYVVILPDFVSPLSSGEENCQPEGDADEEEGEREQGGLVH